MDIGIDLSIFSVTERKLVDILIDGEMHSANELRKQIDVYASRNNLRVHLCSIRRKVKDRGIVLKFVVNNKYGKGYQMFRRLVTAE